MGGWTKISEGFKLKDKETYFYIDVFPAGHGDCFMIRCSENGKKFNILIDGGVPETFEILESYLNAMNDAGECIDLLIVTHIDNDHIGGILKFISENGTQSKPNIIKIKEIWFNSLRHLQMEEKKKEDNKVVISQRSILKKLKDEIYQSAVSDGFNETGVRQGVKLAGILLSKGYEKIWNTSFGKKAVCLEHTEEMINKLPNLGIYLLSPDYGKKLKRLKKVWFNFLAENELLPANYKKGTFYDDAFEHAINLNEEKLEDSEEDLNSKFSEVNSSIDLEKLYNEVEYSDSSPANGSSIAFIIVFQGKNYLFLGDAHSKHIEKTLNKLSQKKTDLNLNEFALIKISHHGSKKNTTKSFLSSIICKNFLISTNGERFNHPDLETMIKIAKMKDKPIEIFTNYMNDNLSQEILDALEESYETFVKPFETEKIYRLFVNEKGDIESNEFQYPDEKN